MHLDAVVIVEDGKSNFTWRVWDACDCVTEWVISDSFSGLRFSLSFRVQHYAERATAHPEREFICFYHNRIYSRPQPEIGFLASDIFPHSSFFWFMKTLRQRAMLST